ncbi:hypothetical protein H6503_00655 [Candidatus Woesearchaeota archaeon]|nr:hypothetical protein [Candidatus Woesearchaeota archaeon]
MNKTSMIFMLILCIFIHIAIADDLDQNLEDRGIKYSDSDGHLSYIDNGDTQKITHSNGDSYVDLPVDWPRDTEILSDDDGITLVVKGNPSSLPRGRYKIEIVGDKISIPGSDITIETSFNPIHLEQKEDDTQVILSKGQMMKKDDITLLVQEETYVSFEDGAQPKDKRYVIIEDGQIRFKGPGIYINKDYIVYLTRENSEDENILKGFKFNPGEISPESSKYDIMKSQAFLDASGYETDVDGIYGPQTKRNSYFYSTDNPQTNINIIQGDNIDVWSRDGQDMTHIATVIDGEINLGRKTTTDSIGIESSDQVLFTGNGGNSLFTKTGSIGSTIYEGGLSKQSKVVPKNGDGVPKDAGEDYEFLQSLLGIPYGPKYPQGPDKDVKHLDCVSLIYCYAEDYKGVDLTGSRGDQIYARHTDPITTLNQNNKDVSDLHTGDIVFIGHPYSGGEGGISVYHLGVVGAPVEDSNGNVIDYTMVHASGSYGKNRATDYSGEVKEEVSMLSYLSKYKDNNRRNNMFIGRLKE